MAFVTLASASQAPPPGELARYEADGTPVAVANVDGRLYAFADTCTHKQCSLSDGDLADTEVVCPCHHGAFDVATGEVTAAPPTEPLATYAVRVTDDRLQIEL